MPWALESADRQIFIVEQIFDVRWLIKGQRPTPVQGVAGEWQAPVHAASFC